jgi:hypothetical protein
MKKAVITLVAFLTLFSVSYGGFFGAAVGKAEASVAPANGLVGYWAMDDGSGSTAIDSSGNGNSATLTNGPTWTAGHMNGAIAFNGNTSFASVLIPTSMWNSFSGGFSVSFWALTSDAAGTVPISAFGSATSFGLYSGSWYIGDGSSWTHINSGISSDGAWHFYAFTWDGTAITSYCDGVKIQQAAFSGASFAGIPNNQLVMGMDNRGSGSYFPGSMDEIRLYNRSLSASEVAAVMNDTGLAGNRGSSGLSGLIDDGLSHPPPATGAYAYNSFALPNTGGASYIDPVFGSTVRRLTTDHRADDSYARNMWWSTDGKRYMHRAPDGTANSDFFDIIDTATGAVTHRGIPIGSDAGDSGFDSANPNVLYTFSGSTIFATTLNGDGTWSQTPFFTAPGGATIGNLGGTINWMDADGRYMIVRYGPEPSVYLYDKQNMAAGPYANPIDGSKTIDTGSYLGLTPDGKFIVGYDNTLGTPRLGMGVSWKIDQVNRAVAASYTAFWGLCGDHGAFISPSDGRDYMVVANCNDQPEIWLVDVANNAAGLDISQQKALPNNKLLVHFPNWGGGIHFTAVAKGLLQDWAFISTEDASDTFSSGTADVNGNITPWDVYRQEIIGFNVMTGEIRRIANHRSRSVSSDYYNNPRLTVSWGGEFVAWNSNFNQNGSIDVYEVPFMNSGGTVLQSADATPPIILITSPSFGAASGTVVFSASANDSAISGQVTSGLKSVTLLVDGSIFATSTASPISKLFDTTILSNGSHSLTAQAMDNAGNSAVSPIVTITVDNASIAKYPRLIALASLEGILTIPANQPITATIFSSSMVLEIQNSLAPNANRQYTVTFLSSDPQLVNIRIKATGYLSQLLSNVDTTVNSASVLSVPQLRAGDLNNDNVINSLDYSIINGHWLQNFPGTDINGDRLVNSLDFAILKNNFGKSGQ